jgi:transcriptional regulator with XRE-family HTH domain
MESGKLNRPSIGIGERLARFRRIAGFSAQRLSDETSGMVSRGTISRIESGSKVDVSVDELILLSAALGIHPAALAVPFERPFANVMMWPEAYATPASLLGWFMGNDLDLEVMIDAEGSTENVYGTAATVVWSSLQDLLREFIRVDREIHLSQVREMSAEEVGRVDQLKIERRAIQGRLATLGVVVGE